MNLLNSLPADSGAGLDFQNKVRKSVNLTLDLYMEALKTRVVSFQCSLKLLFVSGRGSCLPPRSTCDAFLSHGRLKQGCFLH